MTKPNPRRSRPETAAPPVPEARDTLSLALQLLAKEIGRRLQRHPSAHLLSGGRDSVELKLQLPVPPRSGWVEKVRETASASIDAALGRLLLHRSVFQPGRVYCLRCASAGCDHARPARCTDVFAGYTPSGLPRFLDFGQWLLERKDSRVDLLYKSPPGLVAHQTSGDELCNQLLPAFQDADSGYHIHGQVAAGWYRFPGIDGPTESIGLTFQVVSTRPNRGRQRFGLNLIGAGPGGEPLENVFDRLGEIPWLAAARWVQQVLREIERAAAPRTAPGGQEIEKRLAGLLSGLARRLEHQRRAQSRKTRHGHERHREMARPTGKALADLQRAKDESILLDTRRDTLVVLGDKGRAHVFNQLGRLVTSVRYSPFSIERRRQRGIWKPASAAQIGNLRERAVKAHEGDDLEGMG